MDRNGKLRIVFDASARFQGVALNDVLLKGPDLIEPQFGVLLRFQEKKIAVSTDIEKMFNQVSVLENDRSALRYLWRPIGKSKPPYTYEMQVQVFVAVSSPTICNFVLQRAAKDCAAEFPFASTRVEEKYYVDNYHYLTLTIAKKTPERLSKTSSFFWTEEGSN